MADKIVAVGFLTARDITLLGEGFKRHFPVPEGEGDFADLLQQLEKLERSPEPDMDK
jgi:hypothetical protein